MSKKPLQEKRLALETVGIKNSAWLGGQEGERETNKHTGFKLLNPCIWGMHPTLHAVKAGFISVTVNNNDKCILFLGLSVGYRHFKYTFNQVSNPFLPFCCFCW